MTEHQPSFSPKVPLLEQLSSWSGWENLYEHRNKLFAGIIVVVLVLFGIFSLVSNYTTSSATNIIKAEKIVQQLRSPAEPEDSSDTVSYANLLDKLVAIVPAKGDLANRFSGVIAQEEVLQHLPLTQSRWQTVHDVLKTDNLLPYDTLVLITKASNESNQGEALRLIDELSNQEEALNRPILQSYLLLQKASLLFEQRKSNKQILDKLREIISANENVQAIFDKASTYEGVSLVDFLQID